VADVARSVAAATLPRLGARPRLATGVLRLPRVVPAAAWRAKLYRSVSWPLAKQMRASIEVDVVGGSKMLVRTDDSLGRVLAISGVWEPNVTSTFIRSLSPGDVCVDIGAHIGYYTLLASKLVGAKGHVYAFEPSPRSYAALRANLDRNDVENVTAINSAVGQTTGTAELYEGPGTNTGGATMQGVLADRRGLRKPVRVDVRPVTAEIPATDLYRIRVVKIDVEGAEVDVLRSLAPVLAEAPHLALFVELNPKWIAGIPEYVADLCATYGFRAQRIRSGYTLEGLFPDELTEPEDVAAIPEEHCDLLLTR
jgi:FkbM family methyltransferase